MPYHLLTVDHAHAVGGDVQVAPTVRLQRLAADSPGEMKPMRGDTVELRLPDGQVRRAAIRLFGIDGWQKDGYFYTGSNPADPESKTSSPPIFQPAHRFGSRTGIPDPAPRTALLVQSDDPSYGRWPRLTILGLS